MATGGVERCVSGIHAVRPEQLLGWMDDELWTCELGGVIQGEGDMLVAERGRLLERVEAWDELAARDFASACAGRARVHAVEALRLVGHDEEGRELAGLDADRYAARAPDVASGVPDEAAGAVLLAADAVALARGRRPEERAPHLRSHLEAVAAGAPTPGAIAANVAFVVAHSAGSLHPDGYEAGVAAERVWQLGWLRERLGLAA